uniref:Uncharacterized protein n=1 Tax=Rhizophora mucronata TaxID=61149 RepID=A0A2P2NG06_RHIMU
MINASNFSSLKCLTGEILVNASDFSSLKCFTGEILDNCLLYNDSSLNLCLDKS